MNGNVGNVGLLLIGIAIAIVAYVLIRNEGWRAMRDGRQRRGSQLLLGGLAALVGVALIAIALLSLFAR